VDIMVVINDNSIDTTSEIAKQVGVRINNGVRLVCRYLSSL
jgi:hypothetical protein